MAKLLSPGDLEDITSRTLHHYEAHAESYWEGTKDHDVTQNYAAFLDALPKRPGLRLLDLGCGPGRDLLHFRNLGHEPSGLDGSPAFCEMARKHAGCPVWHQNFLQLALPPASFDGVFANASLFHVPQQELPRVLAELRDALVPEGVLFSSNPRGGEEGWSGERYGAYLDWDRYRKYLEGSGFEPVHHYYRPTGLPRHRQPWLAVVSRSRS
ncbi:MAG: class I SAM-dependent DNA methyltransferase [Gammaproteobacteria bacterium]